MSQWQTTNKEIVLTNDPYLRVEYHTVELPDGRTIDDWSWVITPDYINVVVRTTDQRFALFRQTKYGIEGQSLAPVGGYIEDGETPLQAARRELKEEMGMEAAHWQPLGCYRVDANRGCGTGCFFLATEARQVTTPHADDLEEQELVFLSLTEVEAALQQGQFKVLGWVTNIALALLHLQRMP